MSNGGPLPTFPTAGDETRVIEGAEPYARWGRRVGAFLLDGILISIVAIVLTSVTGHHELWNAFKFHTVGGQRKLVPVGSKLLFFQAATALLGFLYSLGFLSSSWQATPGMRAVGIYVARAADLNRVGLGRAAGRGAIFQGISIITSRIPLGSLLIFVDLLWPLWDARRQTIHDKLAGTVVLRRVPTH